MGIGIDFSRGLQTAQVSIINKPPQGASLRLPWVTRSKNTKSPELLQKTTQNTSSGALFFQIFGCIISTK
jgi:hypothetical protein